MIFDILNTDIYYINLDSQLERKSKFISEMLTHGFSAKKLHRVSAVSNKYNDGYDSHIKALKLGLLNNKPFIIIEDDMKVNQIPPKIELFSTGTPIFSAVSLALSRYGVIDELNYQGNLYTSYNYVINAALNHRHVVRIFNMIVGNAVYYHDMNYVDRLINHLESFYRTTNYVSPVTNSKYNNCPFDAMMAFMQPTTMFVSLKTPAFYHPGGLEHITKFTLNSIE
jgi:GR25 family glycosyltransferase involved in LPS biosynthesis